MLLDSTPRTRVLGIGFDEDTAIVVDDERFRVIGSGAVYMVDGSGVTHSNIAEAKPGRIAATRPTIGPRQGSRIRNQIGKFMVLVIEMGGKQSFERAFVHVTGAQWWWRELASLRSSRPRLVFTTRLSLLRAKPRLSELGGFARTCLLTAWRGLLTSHRLWRQRSRTQRLH